MRADLPDLTRSRPRKQRVRQESHKEHGDGDAEELERGLLDLRNGAREILMCTYVCTRKTLGKTWQLPIRIDRELYSVCGAATQAQHWTMCVLSEDVEYARWRESMADSAQNLSLIHI